MKKSTLLLLTFAFLPAPLLADETPQNQMEFVRKLRAKGYNDLALEYLEVIKKQGVTPETQAILSLETARAQIEASQTKPIEERLAVLKGARKDLEAYVKSLPGGPIAARAKLELARLIVHQGKAQLAVAFGEEEAKDRQDKALIAEKVFIEAVAELEAASKMLAEAAAAEKDATQQAQLKQEQLEAKLETGIVDLERAECYLDLAREEFNLKRATIADNAVKTFDSVRSAGLTNRASLLAAAWLVRAYYEKQEPDKAEAARKGLLAQETPESVDAKRLVKYFDILTIPKDVKVKDKEKAIVQKAQAWLDEYKKHHDTPEGQGVQFEMAKAMYQEAKQIDRDPKSPKKAAWPIYERARAIFAKLASSHGEFSTKARSADEQLGILMLDKAAPIQSIKNFNEAFLRARNELMEMSNTKDKDKRDAYLKSAIDAFQHALSVADKNTSPTKIGEAKFLITWAYLVSGNLQKTIQNGEALAKANPTTKNSPAAAGYTLEAYSALMANQDNEENRKKFREFAKFVLETKKADWAEQPVTAVTLYHLGLLNHREDNFKEAIALFETLPKDFTGFNYAQGQIVFMALQAKTRTKDEKEKQFYNDKMLAAMKRITLDGNSSTITMYFLANLEYPKILYTEGATLMAAQKYDEADKKFEEMHTFLAKLNKEFKDKQEELSQDKADAILTTMDVLAKYAQRGRIDGEFQRGNYARAIAADLAGGVVTRVAQLGKDGGPIKLSDHKVTGDILGLALRAYVQLGRTVEAKTTLDLLTRITNEDGSDIVDSGLPLRQAVYALQQQIETLRKQGSEKKATEIATNFGTFLDTVTKDTKKLQADDLFLFAKCYDTIGQHGKAGDLYGKIEKPAFADKKPPLAPEEERAVQTYWYARISYAKQLRLNQDKKENPEAAWKILQEILTNPNARQHMRADFESNMTLEALDPPRYGTAVTRWSKFLTNPVVIDNINKDQSIEEMYYEGYVRYVNACYKYSQQEDVQKKQQDGIFLNRAADWIVRLELDNPDGWQIVGPRLRELMAAEPLLRLRYEDLKEMRKKEAK